MLHKTGKHWLAAILAMSLLGACATLTSLYRSTSDRGINIPHKKHADEGLACADCHEPNDQGEPGMPNHDMCSACHEFDPEKPDDTCKQCHSRPDQKVDPVARLLSPEVIFSHAAHTEKEVDCEQCHTNVEKGVLPAGDRMKFCMDCHAKTDPKLNECSVCHSELDRDVRPTMRRGARIAHDNPQLWESLHGRESRKDPDYCALCHTDGESCDECHRNKAPTSHNAAWRGRSHGLRASWDREKCSVCHEEDSCARCHQNTKPRSHRAGWGEPLNTHCVSCHYPPSDTGCTVCHERIEHPKALASPHNVGVYFKCGVCHPGGSPYRAPHVMNTGIRCMACH
ncbi:MAG: cytochrome c3 family protein [Candidatus Hydrogenedens sp.]|nr:cytochrome c3 family protein [Candidatus Hydrogenedentota bacterium]NLF59457.1 cytochrome c3 family protein [Candidatus Hydrogenedens sp.]